MAKKKRKKILKKKVKEAKKPALLERIPFHPFFMAVYPVIFLLSFNIKETLVGSVLQPVLLSLAGSLIVFFGLKFLLKNTLKAGFITSFLLFIFYSYGHLYNLLDSIKAGETQIFSHAVLVIVVLGASYWAIVGMLKMKGGGNVNLILNAVTGLLVLVVSAQSVYGVSLYHKGAYEKYNKKLGERYKLAEGKNYPDIYFIILDGHGRSDILKEFYDYDNSGFIKGLRKRGFYVADRARSNYCQTFLSVSATYNMEYHKKPEGAGKGADESRVILGEMIRRNKAVEFLREHGYSWVSYFSGFVGTELISIADIYLPGDKIMKKEPGEFDSILFSTTLLEGLQSILNAGLEKKVGPHTAYIRRTQYVLDDLPKTVNIRSPKLVFAHIIAPHPPFVFDENGPTHKYAGTKGVKFADGDHNDFPKEKYKEAYRAQAIFIDREITKTIDRLMKATQGKAVIIIQGDHGPGMYWIKSSMERTNLRERFSILNAIYMPGYDGKGFYPEMTPVNNFRLIFNTYLGGDFRILEDKSYFNTWEKPFVFYELEKEK